MGNITSMQEKDKSGTTPRTTKHAQTNSDESIKSNLSKTNSSKANKKGEVSENTIISSFTAENSMKEKEYSKFMEKVKDFNPKVYSFDIQDSEKRNSRLH
jgi:hypothetical protein